VHSPRAAAECRRTLRARASSKGIPLRCALSVNTCRPQDAGSTVPRISWVVCQMLATPDARSASRTPASAARPTRRRRGSRAGRRRADAPGDSRTGRATRPRWGPQAAKAGRPRRCYGPPELQRRLARNERRAVHGASWRRRRPFHASEAGGARLVARDATCDRGHAARGATGRTRSCSSLGDARAQIASRTTWWATHSWRPASAAETLT
jgi:hypothetical protein